LSANNQADDRPNAWTRPLRFHLSVIVALLLIAIAAVLIAVNYYHARQVALASASREMRIHSDRIVDRYRAVFGSAAAMVDVVSSSQIERRPEVEDQATFARFLQQTLLSSQYVDSAYVGYPTGAFVDAVSIANNPLWRAALSAPADAAFATRIIALDDQGRRLSRWEFLDSGGRWLASTDAQPADYDPRERPWYRGAVQTPALITTGPYRFATTKALGITIARRHAAYGSLVVGADILLDTIDAFLSTQLITLSSRVFIFDAANQLIARSDGSSATTEAECIENCTVLQRQGDLLRDLASAAVVETEHADNKASTLSIGGREYLMIVSPISSTALIGGGHVVSLAPVKDLTMASDRVLRQGLLISAGVVAFGVACAFLMARQISSSLAGITSQAHRLMRFELGDTKLISSRITEISQLGNAMNAARKAISTFGLYVPTDLVRRIVGSGEFTGRSGRKQSVTALFSDIRDFTSICERHSAEQVVTMLSGYFDLVSDVVHRYRGVIIQFSGDAVFALWNAPEVDERHIDHACQCALELKARVHDFNCGQSRLGEPDLATRFGVHTGTAVVGSVGARNRFQYTAMGDAVNIASRLEGINKEFDTTILVSAAVVAGVKSSYCFKSLGSVRVKGREQEVEIFELRDTPEQDVLR
jgi:adenylate cyclase